MSTYIYMHTDSGNALCFSLSDSTGVMVVSLGNGLEENAWGMGSYCPGGTVCLAPRNWSIWGEVDVAEAREVEKLGMGSNCIHRGRVLDQAWVISPPLEPVHDTSLGKQSSLVFHLSLHLFLVPQREEPGGRARAGATSSPRNCEACQ